METIDAFGVPEFYSDRIGTIEDAGNGMMRWVRCVERGGILIPVFSVVSPATSVFLRDSIRIREMAEEIVKGGGSAH